MLNLINCFPSLWSNVDLDISFYILRKSTLLIVDWLHNLGVVGDAFSKEIELATDLLYLPQRLWNRYLVHLLYIFLFGRIPCSESSNLRKVTDVEIKLHISAFSRSPASETHSINVPGLSR